ncbi:cadmium/zinc/cobalt-transporting ATPase [Bacteroidia bacterium]|nr:cadmium/zinc/cobalt-transporting ATPase [Bacteroidia bacterium]
MTTKISEYIPISISFVMLVIGIVLDHFIESTFFVKPIRAIWYVLAYIPVGWSVLKGAFEELRAQNFFNEFSLMSIATIGAFCIGEYAEAVAVMLFYMIGELFQDSAVERAKRNIQSLLDLQPDQATVWRNNTYEVVAPAEVNIGEQIRVKAGEKVPLDGVMLSDYSNFNTAALTGEIKPKTLRKGESVLAGMMNLDKVIEIQVEKTFSDSSLAKILDMVQNAAARKSKTELLIRKLAKIYTPIVFFMAVAITVLPVVFTDNYVFGDWLYRALVFLVISCPCALVISIPLGYFGGIGAASAEGILFKGANYLDTMLKIRTIVMDKTGTITEGVFEVQNIVSPVYDPLILIDTVAALESASNHPIAKAIVAYHAPTNPNAVSDIEEILGYGLKGAMDGQTVLAGNTNLMRRYDISYDHSIDAIPETTVVVAIDGRYAGYITIADRIKDDAREAIEQMHRLGLKTVMLSGDKSSITQKVGTELQIDEVFGDLLPEDKVRHVERLKAEPDAIVAFVGDGINDAPVLAMSDVGIAMGAMGSDVAIEVADVVIQTDQLSKIITAIHIAQATKRIVMQNIVLAAGVKSIVLLMGAMGIATLWEAVFADVGVALLAVLNAVRILKQQFRVGQN